MPPDAIDRELIDLLTTNARLPAAELGRRLKLSRTTIQSRIERLERNGTILGYTVRAATDPSDPMVRAHVLITLAPKKTASVEIMLRKIPQVRELHAVSGNVDLIAVISGTANSELDRVIDQIGELDGVVRTNSMILLSTRISR
ncbi:Lrp/AsnC family transcriptional regulator [Lichenicola cladoniae]|uniref:Lrp/AsnC family transcriptional regulator n=1 Tax=Lichenicola cladoniae TaxID=1484109 RepID=A0A6M8HRZ3_9PROT|nr:Lrp/AsnC family transcriptional regulator [Lichenicola cladoniae]NPD65697.1 Lrp/AsnC family transcriptional regulator [Acetobacteraceae bacterium]QKE91279.1 Lrp/AsnC family transcriptional regulator [Lichenicola cladoniae]